MERRQFSNKEGLKGFANMALSYVGHAVVRRKMKETEGTNKVAFKRHQMKPLGGYKQVHSWLCNKAISRDLGFCEARCWRTMWSSSLVN